MTNFSTFLPFLEIWGMSLSGRLRFFTKFLYKRLVYFRFWQLTCRSWWWRSNSLDLLRTVRFGQLRSYNTMQNNDGDPKAAAYFGYDSRNNTDRICIFEGCTVNQISNVSAYYKCSKLSLRIAPQPLWEQN